MIKKKLIKRIFATLLLALLATPSGVFYFAENVAEAKTKPTKWQTMLEENKVDQSLWAKYLPTISRTEYNKVKMKLDGKTEVKAQKKSKKTKWQKMLEKNNVDQSLWRKYLPKVSRKEYLKVKKALRSMGLGGGSLGPTIRIGLFSLNPNADSSDRRVKVKTVAGSYTVKNLNGTVLASVSADTVTDIKLEKNKNFSFNDVEVGNKIRIEAADTSGVIKIDNCKNDKYDTDADGNRFAIGCYGDYDEFRGTLELSQDDEGTPWVIDELPLEQYTWGTGEIGDCVHEYYKLFSIVFRTYGYRNLESKKSTHAKHNFDLSDTSSDQIYKGYKIEENYPDMKRAAAETRGQIVTYKGKTALTPYCSWSDGRTRNFPGDYPYLKGGKDKYGKHPTKSTKELKDEGNHMYGLVANGARKMVEKGKTYKQAIAYYLKGVDITGAY
ncbi:MAG: SpoIID/LytB domain-containing protein [Parcubacteria group bacterium]